MATAAALSRLKRVAALPLLPVGRRPGLFRGFASSMKELWDRRELAFLLSRREVKARYSDSSLGLAWSLMRPLAQLAVYYYAIGEVLGAARAIDGFGFFVFVGLTGWGFYTEIISRATSSIITNQGIVKKIYLPREIFPLASLGSALFTLGVQLVIYFGASAILGKLPAPGALWYALLGLLVLTAFGLALGLVLAALNVYFRDIEHMVEVLIIVFFWVSPVVYSYSLVHDRLEGGALEVIYLANPVTVAILGLQRGMWASTGVDPGVGAFPPNLEVMLFATLAVSLVLLWLAQRVFARLQGNFAQEL